MAKTREEKNATHIYTDFNMKVRFTDDREGMNGSFGAFILNNKGAVELDERITSIKRRAIKAMQKAVDEFNANDKNPSVVSFVCSITQAGVVSEDKSKSRPTPREWNSHYYKNK